MAGLGLALWAVWCLLVVGLGVGTLAYAILRWIADRGQR